MDFFFIRLSYLQEFDGKFDSAMIEDSSGRSFRFHDRGGKSKQNGV